VCQKHYLKAQMIDINEIFDSQGWIYLPLTCNSSITAQIQMSNENLQHELKDE
jgi:hypothetical protein